MKKISKKDLTTINTTVHDFMSQFGDDVYSSILLEVIFGKLYGRPIHLLRESEQSEPEDTNDYEGKLPTYKIE